MSHCVPSWDIEDDDGSNLRRTNASFSNSMSSNLDVPLSDYQVKELTWKNGQLALHGLGPPRLGFKYTWDATETLEALVDQATFQPHHKPHMDPYANDLVPWLDYHNSATTTGSVCASAATMDALVPSSATKPNALVSGSTHIGSCNDDRSGLAVALAGITRDWSSCRDQQSVSGSETFGLESSQQLTFGLETPDDTISGKPSTKSAFPDEHDSVCHSRSQMNELEEKKKGKVKCSSISTKRSRAAAIHNQSERRRRDKINEKMKALQKLVPNANKTDKASMLDEVIEYVKQLQAQIHMMGRINMSPMMMPLAMQQQQLQMAMLNPMGMGLGMGMGMAMPPGVIDIGGSHPNIPGMQPVFHPSAPFVQPLMAPWEMHNTGDHVPVSIPVRVSNHNDPVANFLASQSQPMTMDGYRRLAALFRQMQNQYCYSSGLMN
ncbi:hypothetical protein R6Q57_007068 [Mikania cordata]